MLNSFKLIAFLPTTDYKRARSFYEGLLGLEYVSEDQFALVLRSDGNMIRVGRFESFTPAKNTILGWEVSAIEKVVAALKEKGVSFEKYPWVNDPVVGTNLQGARSTRPA